MKELDQIINSNYPVEVIKLEKIKNAYKVTTTEGLKCFKASKYDTGQYKFIIQVLTHLIANNYENIPEIYKTIHGESFIGYEDRYGFLCDWIDSREADFENPIDLKLCIDTLGKLHLASRGFQYNEVSNIRYLFGKWIQRFKKRCDELLYFKAFIVNKEKNLVTEFDRMYLKAFEKHYKQGIKAIKDLENSSYYSVMEKHKHSSCFCHHDTANHNFLITSELEVFLIDFDYCIYDTFLHDLGSIIIRNLKYGNWSFSKMEYILNIYCKSIPISKEEIHIMFCFMEFPQDFWQIGLQYYIENKIWSEEVFLKKLKHVLVDAPERNEFLSDYEGKGII